MAGLLEHVAVEAVVPAVRRPSPPPMPRAHRGDREPFHLRMFTPTKRPHIRISQRLDERVASRASHHDRRFWKRLERSDIATLHFPMPHPANTYHRPFPALNPPL